MELTFASHAVDRMVQRNLTTDLVRQVLDRPDGVIRQSSDKIIAYQQVEGRSDNAVAVVAMERDSGVEVITVMVNFEVVR